MVLIMKSGRKYHLRRIYWYMSLWLKKTFYSDAKERNTYALKKIIIRHRINEKSYTNISYTKIRIIYFLLFYWSYTLAVFEKKVFHDMHSSDFLITFHRSKFLKTSYSFEKKTIFKSKWKVKTNFSWSVNHNKGNVKIRKEPL